ncbi:AbrB family transcriptional regulator [Mesorhizobium sp. VK23B]|uniref:AbrB family transcriptional regulator n=1 Tax=Mesorhizobium dulcispinae TaxID=3072316 RepID=A0ABU4XM09_9HYPH|nr:MULTISPECIES: AbrB family transcriptional regulator [unclassified Mesorhizobium]MDX8469447.1 AbrB family transcriptional regulator [Mesorhizobium sp. VK23B]MDX8475786.1 AbrB family transcriptional regulator [Mesorhizobium sp. VK23A]MDX8516910.1 AbrB family transcriptional regulator [Mesorhizobium sp. VK23D]
MTSSEKLTTTVSTKGQVTLPSAIRKLRNWGAGTHLQIEDTPQGVLLRPAQAFAPTRPEEVFGVLPHSGVPKTLQDMDASVFAEAQQRHAGD